MGFVGPHSALIKALFQVVWVDDVVSPHEAKALADVLRKLGVSPPEIICLLDENLSQPPTDQEPVPLEQVFTDRAEQMEAMQALMTVCFSDGQIKPEQLGYIEGLVVRMGLTSSELETLRQKAMEARL